ncbi:methyltransferase domain-containing protein [Sulfuritalea sp.]|uniref:methyltransferase domain-containing protein n=1 Tax=Sulfuritalea sp. TaxID=2480090 RepID=UPI00286D6DDE|nr:methyltransferase domain-containing protein [Sulfuritalea sp.]
MVARDPHRFVNELDKGAIDRLIARLESRAKDAVFTRLFDKYAARIDPGPAGQVLEVGCGTGAMTRALARRTDFSGKATGVDQSAHFIDAARQFAQDESVAQQVDFLVGDAHSLDFPDGTFDAVFAHTLISHVTDPAAVLREMVRMLRPGGTLAIFDGDYASMTYGHPDHELGHRMDAALVRASFNNPRIMRDLPRLMPGFGLTLTAAWGDAVVEVGSGSYFKSFVETYASYIAKAGLAPADTVEAWLATQRQSLADGTFFAACTYYTYLAQRS